MDGEAVDSQVTENEQERGKEEGINSKYNINDVLFISIYIFTIDLTNLFKYFQMTLNFPEIMRKNRMLMQQKLMF